MTSRTLFVRFSPRLIMSSCVALPAASHGEQGTPTAQRTNTLPALRFAGVPGLITSRSRRQRPHSLHSGTVPVRQSKDAHPDSSRRDHRTHAAHAAAEFSGLCPQPPHWGRVYSTPCCIILTTHNSKRDSRRGAKFDNRHLLSFQGVSALPPEEKGLSQGKPDRNSYLVPMGGVCAPGQFLRK